MSAQLLFFRKACNASSFHFPFSHCSFLLYSILRALIVGFLQITSDYLLKPVLAVIFNGLLQPQFIFTQNIFQSICNTLEPLTKLMAITMKPLTDCVRAFRIVEVKNLNKDPATSRYQTFQGQNNAWRIDSTNKNLFANKTWLCGQGRWDGMGCSHLQIGTFRALEHENVFLKYLRLWHAKKKWNLAAFLLKNFEIHLKSKTDKERYVSNLSSSEVYKA